MWKIIIASIMVISLFTGSFLWQEKNQKTVEVQVVNQTDSVLQSVRLEVGVAENTSPVVELQPDEEFMWKFTPKNPAHLRMQYQNTVGTVKDLIVHGYIEPGASGKIRIIVQKIEDNYKIAISQSIRK